MKGSNSLEMYLDPELWRDAEILSVADRVEGYVVANPNYPATRMWRTS